MVDGLSRLFLCGSVMVHQPSVCLASSPMTAGIGTRIVMD